MKKKILFVDDQPLVLQGLKRMLRRKRSEWELTFVTDGAEALRKMDEDHYDVVVSDMRMPKMSGAQLLSILLEKHPDTVRIVLSGQADQDMILESVGTVHQYLTKPCEPEQLTSAIEHSCSVQDLLKDSSLKNALGSMSQLPTIPNVYMELNKKLEEPDVDIEDLGKIVLQDVGLTVNLLKLVNSAFFSVGTTITTPAEVISRLGIEMTKVLILALGTFHNFDPTKLGGLKLSELWSHSTKVGMYAQTIASLETNCRKTQEECFIAGLLHDTGKLLLAANFPEKYEEVIHLQEEHMLRARDAERKVFGVCHGVVGGYLLGLWGLPPSVVTAIANHHVPPERIDESFSPLTAVHFANAFSRNGSPMAQQVDERYLRSLGLLERSQAWQEAIEPSKVES